MHGCVWVLCVVCVGIMRGGYHVFIEQLRTYITLKS